ncbi:MAG: CoA transferase, partial [Myxococcales bacterium]|nr:CoA transferase [Myxococcales bacterium]
RALNPGLVYCAITGFGQTGPLAQRAGHDLGYLALAGLLGTTGTGDQVVQPGFQAADLAGGALYGVVGILAALFARQRTGEGQLVDASMTDGVAGLGIMMHARQHLEGAPIGPGADTLAGSQLCYRVYRCADGRHLAVGALEPKFWQALCVALGIPELKHDGLISGTRKGAVEAQITALFASQPRDHWVQALAQSDVCTEPVLSLDEVRESPQATARGWFGTHRHPGEGAEFLHQYPNPGLLPEAPPPPVAPAPLLGEHTRAVLAELGCAAEEIDGWLSRGAVRQA